MAITAAMKLEIHLVIVFQAIRLETLDLVGAFWDKAVRQLARAVARDGVYS